MITIIQPIQPIKGEASESEETLGTGFQRSFHVFFFVDSSCNAMINFRSLHTSAAQGSKSFMLCLSPTHLPPSCCPWKRSTAIPVPNCNNRKLNGWMGISSHPKNICQVGWMVPNLRRMKLLDTSTTNHWLGMIQILQSATRISHGKNSWEPPPKVPRNHISFYRKAATYMPGSKHDIWFMVIPFHGKLS